MSSKSAIKLVVAEDAPVDAVQVGGHPDRLEERAQGRRLLPRRPAADRRRLPAGAAASWPALVLTALVVAALLMRGELGHGQHEGQVPPDVLATTARSTCSRPRGSSCSARATSGSSSACRSFCCTVLGWNFWQVGGFPGRLGHRLRRSCRRRRRPAPAARRRAGRRARRHDRDLAGVPAGRVPGGDRRGARWPASTRPWSSSAGLIAFGVVFALNSAVHSYLILAYTDSDKVAMNVGFYYMANACGRLAGTVLSGLLYQGTAWSAACGPRSASCSRPG